MHLHYNFGIIDMNLFQVKKTCTVPRKNILNSKRSEKCIGFIIMRFYYLLCIYSIYIYHLSNKNRKVKVLKELFDRNFVPVGTL